MLKGYIPIFALLAATVVGQLEGSPAASPMSSSDVEAWRQDLAFLAAEMPRIHPNLHHAVSKAELDSAFRRLERRLPSLTREGAIVELARVVALVHEGHTQMGLADDPKIGFGRYPLALYLYSDGLFVRAAPESLRGTLGARVLRIGNKSAREAMRAVRPIVQHDNEMTIRDVLPNRLVLPEVLFELGVCPDRSSCTYRLEAPDGHIFDARVEEEPRDPNPSRVRANVDSDRPLPLYLRHRDANYWFEYLEGSRTLYLQYNAVENSPDEPFARFCDRVFAFIGAHPVEVLVVDLRLNNGGDNTLNAPLIQHIRANPELNRRGHLYAIVGRLTFSAAMNCAMDLEKKTAAIFVGEPTGSSPNQYGDAAEIVLPHSQIVIRLSTRYWEDGGPADRREALEPQIRAELSSKDFLTNRDPALEAILSRVR